jgi:protein-tyrosine phosphatase
MIDIHCHVLPGLDDGPGGRDEAVELGRALAEQGVRAVGATPHVSRRYPNTLEDIAAAAEGLRSALSEAGVELQVVPGAEVSANLALELGAEELAALAFGGAYLVVEPPRVGGLRSMSIMVSLVLSKGLTPILAHPERVPEVQADPGRLDALRSSGALVQVVSNSLEGKGEREASRAAWTLLERDLVDSVGSDAHGASRPPRLRGARSALADRYGHAYADWLLCEVPAAVLVGDGLPRRPPRAAVGGDRRRIRPGRLVGRSMR